MSDGSQLRVEQPQQEGEYLLPTYYLWMKDEQRRGRGRGGAASAWQGERTIKPGAAPGQRVCIVSSRLLEFNLIHFFLLLTFTPPSTLPSINRNVTPPRLTDRLDTAKGAYNPTPSQLPRTVLSSVDSIVCGSIAPIARGVCYYVAVVLMSVSVAAGTLATPHSGKSIIQHKHRSLPNPILTKTSNQSKWYCSLVRSAASRVLHSPLPSTLLRGRPTMHVCCLVGPSRCGTILGASER